jgi:hypothetical protein
MQNTNHLEAGFVQYDSLQFDSVSSFHSSKTNVKAASKEPVVNQPAQMTLEYA